MITCCDKSVRPSPNTNQAAVVEPIFAWYTDVGQSPSLYQVAKRLSEAQIPTPGAANAGMWPRYAAFFAHRPIWGSPTEAGPAPAHRRKSALQPVGTDQSHQPVPAEVWIAVPVPAIISEATFAAAQHHLDRNVQRARRHHTTYAYILRGLVSCSQCRLTCGGHPLHPGYHYYFYRGEESDWRAPPQLGAIPFSDRTSGMPLLAYSLTEE
jgi:site-specific DNA recombinase